MIFKDECELKIINDTNIIITTVVTQLKNQLINNLKSIILYGSYGREEGAFYKRNGKIFTYNDYDILLIVTSKIDEDTIISIKQILLKRIEIKWIDLSQMCELELKNLKPSIFNYDLKYGSKVIWGDPNILKSIPSFKPVQLTYKDAEILFNTRLYTFISSVDDDTFRLGLKGENSRFFRNQMAKAILAAVDVLLIEKGYYRTSYIERNKKLKKIINIDNKTIELADWALKEKLYPSDTNMTGPETFSLFSDTLRLFLNVMYNALTTLYGTNIRNAIDLSNAKKYSLLGILNLLKYLIKTGELSSQIRRYKIQTIQSLAVEKFLHLEKTQTEYYLKSLKIIKQLLPNDSSNYNNWNELRIQILKIAR